LKLWAWLRDSVRRIEDLGMTGFQWLVMFSAIVVARNFLEQFGPEKVVFNFASFFVHFPFAYVAPILALSLILSLLARERIEKVTKLMLFAWFLTLVPPIIDLVIGRGTASRIAYLYVDRESIFGVFLHLFNPAVNLKGTTAGIRIEAFLGCCLACGYVWFKSRSIGRTVATLLVIYCTFILFFTLPYTLIAAISFFSPKFSNVGSLYFDSGLFLRGHVDRVACSIAMFDLVLITALLLAWTRLYSRKLFLWLFRRVRRFVPIHLTLALLFGILLAVKPMDRGAIIASLHIYDAVAVLSLLASVVCVYWVSSAADAWGEWEGKHRFTVFVALCLAVFFSGLVGYPALVFSLSLLAFLLLYYSGPLKLSDYFPVGPALMGLATLSCMLIGFSTVAGTMVPRFFPKEALLVALLSCSLGFTAKDYTIGRRRGRQVAALLLLLGFASVGLVLRSAFLVWSGIVLGAVASSSLLLRVKVRAVAYTTYAVLATLIGFMVLRGEVPSLAAREPLPGEILHLERGREFQIGRMFAHAAIEFEGAVARGWKDAETFFALGFAYEETGELEQSAYWYRKAVALDTGYVEAYNNLGVVLRRLGNPDSSVVVLRRGIQKDPGSGRLQRNMFLALFDSGRYGELIRLLGGYLDVNPGDYRMREVLADAYMHSGDLEGAEREYRTVLGTRMGYAPAIVGLGYILANRGKVDEAQKHFLIALEIDPDNVDAMHRLGYLHLQKGKVSRAIVLFREAVKREPLVANHYDSLGDAYMKAERFEEAKRAYEMAVSLDSTASHAKDKLKELENLR
jgi:Flp pilus assembly protein TadD